jgi:membrane protein YdbS with pleckstrin-like domain
MRTFTEPSSPLQNACDLLARLANSTTVMLCLILVATSGAAALAVSELPPIPVEKPTLVACQACVMDLWFTPTEMSVDL